MLAAAGLWLVACSGRADVGGSIPDGANARGDGRAPMMGTGGTSPIHERIDADVIHERIDADVIHERIDADVAGDGLDDAVVVPEDLTLVALPGGSGVLDVIAFTLQKRSDSTEIYAAVKNNGDIPACSAAVSFELFDDSKQSMAAGIGGLLTRRFYRRVDGSGAIAACVGPGDVTMAAVTSLPADLAVEDVRSVVYRCPYFALDVVPIEGLSIGRVTAMTTGEETVYAGTLVNGLEVTVSDPSVTVFPVNRVGRPLGVAVGSAAVEIPPGGSWGFETAPVGEPGTDHVAFPAAALEDAR